MELVSATENSKSSNGNPTATATTIGHDSVSQGIIASSGITFRLWRLYQQFWLVSLVFPLIALLQAPGSPAHLILGLGGLACFARCYTWLMWLHPASRTQPHSTQPWEQMGVLVILVALAVGLSLTYGLAFLWLFIGVSACAGVILPSIPAFVVVSLLMVLPVAISLLEERSFTRMDWPPCRAEGLAVARAIQPLVYRFVYRLPDG